MEKRVLYDSALEVTERPFCSPALSSPSWSSHKPTQIQGEGTQTPPVSQKSIKEFAGII